VNAQSTPTPTIPAGDHGWRFRLPCLAVVEDKTNDADYADAIEGSVNDYDDFAGLRVIMGPSNDYLGNYSNMVHRKVILTGTPYLAVAAIYNNNKPCSDWRNGAAILENCPFWGSQSDKPDWAMVLYNDYFDARTQQAWATPTTGSGDPPVWFDYAARHETGHVLGKAHLGCSNDTIVKGDWPCLALPRVLGLADTQFFAAAYPTACP
jgi:hypothetical protein